jgi:proline iminopeptidase
MRCYCLPGLLLTLGALAGCGDGADALVPPTADVDPLLPQLEIQVAGHARRVHLETFGEEGNPVLLVYHGGDGSDYRAMLPLQALADRYFVVMWDARGSGLSERITASEVSEQAFADEVHAVKRHYAPKEPATLLGYSSGGFYAALALKHYPADFSQLALIEPDPFDSATRDEVNALDIPPSADWVNAYLWQNEFLTPDQHQLADYKVMSVAQSALQGVKCDASVRTLYPLWRLGAHVMAHTEETFAGADYRDAMAAHEQPVLIVATQCGRLGAEFQRTVNAPVFRKAKVVEIGHGVNHLNVFDAGRSEVLTALRGFLNAYEEEL